jgi:hypothetical protein
VASSDGEWVEGVRARSKDLFRHAYMLEVCASIERADGRVNLTALLAGTGLSPSLYSGPLRRLAGLGLLLEDPQPSDDHRERWYRPARSHLWLAARELAQG